MIYNAGEYLFTPTRGCSTEPIAGINKVEVLWEMNNEAVAPTTSIFSTIKYAGDKITFTTPETFVTGNALIAAKDVNDKILWSWHIWACEDQISTVKYDSEGKYLMMDRSLGALAGGVNSPSNNNKYSSSLLYQWGRKDPFPGQTIDKAAADRKPIKVDGIAKTIASGPKSMSEAIANPTVFYTGTSHWTDSSEGLWNSTQKTIYDPCPAGYIVPSKNVFSEEADLFYNGYGSSRSSGGSFVYKLNGTVYCFPLSAYYRGTDGTRDGKGTVYMWTADISDESMPISCYMYYSSGTYIETEYPMPGSTGASIRCMKMNKKD